MSAQTFRLTPQPEGEKKKSPLPDSILNTQHCTYTVGGEDNALKREVGEKKQKV